MSMFVGTLAVDKLLHVHVHVGERVHVHVGEHVLVYDCVVI